MSAREIERAVAISSARRRRRGFERTSDHPCEGAWRAANIAERDADVANAIARAVRGVDPSLALLAIALSEQTFAARAGLRVVNECRPRLYGRRTPAAEIRRRRGYRGYRKSQRSRARHAASGGLENH
jgi:hypothetical protein